MAWNPGQSVSQSQQNAGGVELLLPAWYMQQGTTAVSRLCWGSWSELCIVLQCTFSVVKTVAICPADPHCVAEFETRQRLHFASTSRLLHTGDAAFLSRLSGFRCCPRSRLKQFAGAHHVRTSALLVMWPIAVVRQYVTLIFFVNDANMRRLANS